MAIKNWRKLFSKESLTLAREYYEDDDVKYLEFNPEYDDEDEELGMFAAVVFGHNGSIRCEYDVCMEVRNNKIINIECTCNKNNDNLYCEHVAAVFLQAEYEDYDNEYNFDIKHLIKNFQEKLTIKQLVMLADEDKVRSFLIKLLENNKGLFKEFEKEVKK